ncbi:MAG: hypothetical protein NTZ74_02675, partial [Chloroflexi bacterium]|nr:hypothetical protein [Chloroflexota bacterium]
ILLSIATHLKIYPAAFFAFLLFTHGKKLFFPVIIVNIVFLFSLGPGNAIEFFQVFRQGYGSGSYYWVGNHSGISFAETITAYFPRFSPALPNLQNLFTTIPIVIWIVSFFMIARRKTQWLSTFFFRSRRLRQYNISKLPDNSQDEKSTTASTSVHTKQPSIQNLNHNRDSIALYMIMITIPLMEIVPKISYDYKLVILNTAILILISIISTRVVQKSNIFDYLQLVLITLILLIIGRSFAINNPLFGLLNNKYLSVLFLQLLILINVLIPLQRSRALSDNNSFEDTKLTPISSL